MLKEVDIHSNGNIWYFCRPTERLLKRIEEIKPLAENLGFCYSERKYDYGLESVEFQYDDYINKGDCDCNTIKIRLDFHSLYKSTFDDFEEKGLHRLNCFEELLKDAEQDSTLLKNVNSLWNVNNKYIEMEGKREQVRKYDYTFYF